MHRITHLSLFSILKTFNGFPLYLQLIAPLVGIFHLVKDRRILLVSLPLFFLVGLNFISLCLNGFPQEQILRLCQFFLILMFFNYISFNIDLEVIKNILTTIAILTLVFFTAELTLSDQIGHILIKGLKIPHYSFLVGEANFSGVLFLGLFLVSFLVKERKFAALFFVFSLLTFSRAVFLSVVVFIVLAVLNKISKSLLKDMCTVLLVLLLSYPFLSVLSNKFLPPELSMKVAEMSPRYYLHGVYSFEGMKSVLGEGYFQSKHKIDDWALEYESKFLWMAQWKHRESAEQHSLQVQVISDFGLVGYLLFSIFIVLAFKVVWNNGPYYAISFLTLLINFSFLNALNEWIFYFFLAVNIYTANRGHMPLTTPFAKYFRICSLYSSH